MCLAHLEYYSDVGHTGKIGDKSRSPSQDNQRLDYYRDIVFWFLKLPLTFGDLPELKYLQVKVRWAKVGQCRHLSSLTKSHWELWMRPLGLNSWGWVMVFGWHTLCDAALLDLFQWVATWSTGHFTVWILRLVLTAAPTCFEGKMVLPSINWILKGWRYIPYIDAIFISRKAGDTAPDLCPFFIINL